MLMLTAFSADGRLSTAARMHTMSSISTSLVLDGSPIGGIATPKAATALTEMPAAAARTWCGAWCGGGGGARERPAAAAAPARRPHARRLRGRACSIAP
jgi:hypothetical protein